MGKAYFVTAIVILATIIACFIDFTTDPVSCSHELTLQLTGKTLALTTCMKNIYTDTQPKIFSFNEFDYKAGIAITKISYFSTSKLVFPI